MFVDWWFGIRRVITTDYFSHELPQQAKREGWRLHRKLNSMLVNFSYQWILIGNSSRVMSVGTN